MDQCGLGGGHALLQRHTSTGVAIVDLPPLSNLPLSLAAETHLVTKNVSLSRNASLLETNRHNSSLESQIEAVVFLSRRFLDILPNSTTYEANRKELGNALFLNVSVFALGLAVWAICPCIVAAWRRRAANRDSDGAGSSSGLESGSPADSGQPYVNADAPKRNYLLYMLVCMYTCIVLSFVNMCFLLPHGLVGKVLFGGWSILYVLGQVSFWEIYLITCLDGIIILLFSELFEQLIELPEKDLAQDQLRRSVWMQGLPTNDSLRWWRQFNLNPMEVNRVRQDLSDALTDFLHVPSLNAGAAFGTRRPAQGASTSTGFAEISGLYAHTVMPTTPAPVDLKGTDWRCYLDGGNPYFLNTATGQAQWEVPTELSMRSRPVDSPVVESINVALIVDEWLNAHRALQNAQEYLAAYEERLSLAQTDDAQHATGGLLNQLRGFMQRPAIWWYERKIAGLRPTIAWLTEDLDRIRSGKKRISGSAFVTFKHPRHRDRLLQETEDAPVPTWIWARSHTFFSFGRPPFASVTLSCERAPHPSDVNWQNMHVAWWQRELVFWSLASLLLFTMVVLVTVVRISEFVVPIIELAHQELDSLEEMRIWKQFVPKQVKKLVTTLNTDMIWQSLFEQVPTLVLLFVNSTMVPAAITAIAKCERTVKLSDAELTRMLVNFFFLFTNTVVVPFCGVASLSELIAMLLQAMQKQGDPEPFQGLIFASPGMFALKYLMNATFISSANQLVQVSQVFGRWCQLTFVTVTERDWKEYMEPWPFHWGYWYAWTLSVFSLGIMMSVACPSTLPIAALFFFVKYNVDKYNLDNGVYACGTDIEGGLAIRVVCYLRVVVAIWWMAMGALIYSISVFDPYDNLNAPKKAWFRRGGVTLMIMGVGTFSASWWLKAQHLLRLRIKGPKRKSAPDCWDSLAEALYLTGNGPRFLAGANSTSTSATTMPPCDIDTATVSKNSKRKGQPLSWDGAQVLGLES